MSADPVDPLPARSHHELLADLTPAAVGDLVALAGAETRLAAGDDRGAPARWGAGRAGGRHCTRWPAPGPGTASTPSASPASPQQSAAVRAHLASLAERMAPHATGDTYLNFLDLDGATPERVRAAFTPADRHRLSTL